MILNPKRLSWKLYFRLIKSQYSMLRTLEYERIRGITLAGLTLDLGGGKINSYINLFKIKGKVESVNINPEMQPTFLADLNEKLPIPDNSYDNIISLNTLEHIYKDEFVIYEIYRILKPGGKIIIVVPFLYRVHTSPSDFHRHTAYWWDRVLVSTGFEKNSIKIDPLIWDILGPTFALSESWSVPRFPSPNIIRSIRRAILTFVGVFYQSVRWGGYERFPSNIGILLRNYAVGYFIEAKKPF
jgi:SAM-dependent methyltransferase